MKLLPARMEGEIPLRGQPAQIKTEGFIPYTRTSILTTNLRCFVFQFHIILLSTHGILLFLREFVVHLIDINRVNLDPSISCHMIKVVDTS